VILISDDASSELHRAGETMTLINAITTLAIGATEKNHRANNNMNA